MLTASLWCVYEYGAANVRVGRKGVGNVYPMVSKGINGHIRTLADGQGSVLVFVEAEVLRLLAESAITRSSSRCTQMDPEGSMSAPKEE